MRQETEKRTTEQQPVKIIIFTNQFCAT